MSKLRIDKVPGSLFIAETYAKIIQGFIRDYRQSGGNETVHIIELGADIGRFSYHILKRLMKKNINNTQMKYIMTDLAKSRIDLWQGHPCLKPLCKMGIVEFALYDLENHSEISLKSSGEIISEGTLKTPVIVLINTEESINYIHNSYEDKEVTMSSTSIQGLEKLKSLTTDNMLLLTVDERDTTCESSSLMAKGHAIRKFVESKGGVMISNSKKNKQINISACLIGESQRANQEILSAYEEAVEEFGPEDYITLRKVIESECTILNIEQFIAYVKWSVYDTKVFFDYYDLLMERIQYETEETLEKLNFTIGELWEHYYPMKDDKNLALCCGNLLYKMGYYEESIKYFQYSLDYYYGEND